jgi:8-oxo-dGTP diphosphatase
MSVGHRIVLVVAGVLVKPDGRLLIAKRPEGRRFAGLWELPGGKLEAGEGPETALARELGEELGIAVAEPDLVPLSFASHAYADFHLLMPIYGCKRWQGEAEGLEGQALAWVKPEELAHYPMPPADDGLKHCLGALIERLGWDDA